MHLEDALAAEMPGILWRLIKLAPTVFNGDNPPAVVVDATQDVFDENDVARPFIEGCLVADADAVTPIPEIEEAARKWQGGLIVGDVDLERIMQGVKAKWSYGRKRAAGRTHPVRGLVGVRLVAS